MKMRGFTLPEVLIALVVIGFMIPGILSYQATALLLITRGRARIECATAARTLMVQHGFDSKKTRIQHAEDILTYAEQPIGNDSPLARYEGLVISTVKVETPRLPDAMLFATLITKEKEKE